MSDERMPQPGPVPEQPDDVSADVAAPPPVTAGPPVPPAPALTQTDPPPAPTPPLPTAPAAAPATPAPPAPAPATAAPPTPAPATSVPPAPVSPPTPQPAPPPSPAVEPPSPDVALADEASPLPGAHRGGFLRLPTAPVAVTSQSAPAEPGTEEEPPSTTAQWLMPATAAPHRGLAAWALAFSIAGLVVSLFVGWGFPIGLVGVVSAILALRRPLESRAVAVWALAIGGVSILYSAGWLLHAASRISAGG